MEVVEAFLHGRRLRQEVEGLLHLSRDKIDTSRDTHGELEPRDDVLGHPASACDVLKALPAGS